MHTQNDNRSEQPQQQTTAAFCTKLLFRENPSKCTRRKMQSAPFNKQNRLRSNEKCLQDGEPLANRPPHVFPTNLLLQAIVCFLLSPSKHSVNAAGDRQLWKLPSFHSSTRTSHGTRTPSQGAAGTTSIRTGLWDSSPAPSSAQTVPFQRSTATTDSLLSEPGFLQDCYIKQNPPSERRRCERVENAVFLGTGSGRGGSTSSRSGGRCRFPRAMERGWDEPRAERPERAAGTASPPHGAGGCFSPLPLATQPIRFILLIITIISIIMIRTGGGSRLLPEPGRVLDALLKLHRHPRGSELSGGSAAPGGGAARRGTARHGTALRPPPPPPGGQGRAGQGPAGGTGRGAQLRMPPVITG